MGISAKIIADSIGPAGVRLTTWELTYPRFIHAELMTYRMFSRNAASSRAIPVKKMMERIRKEPAMPVYWGANQAGMQARTELSPFKQRLAKAAWLLGCRFALFTVWLLLKLNVHKQIANRVTEPWMYITTIVTADEYAFANMWHQRDHADAQPEFRHLTRLMWVDFNCHQPKKLSFGQWHLPFIDKEDERDALLLIQRDGWPDDGLGTLSILKQVSTGRCARVSYLTHDGIRDIKEDIKLHDKLKNSNPGHWSPFEHVAQALSLPATQANFHGWTPYRMTFSNEFMTDLREWKPKEYATEIMESLDV